MKLRVNRKERKLLLIVGLLIVSYITGMFLYYANKPIFKYNIIEDNFEDNLAGFFPLGWLSVVNPFNTKVVNDNGNNVMEVKDLSSQEVTEICRRFKKTTSGIIECKVKVFNLDAGFVIHIPQRDIEYNPYDDIIIIFYDGLIYVAEEDNILELDEDPSVWSWLRLTNPECWLIDEWNLKDFEPASNYQLNIWYTIKITFDRENFILTINGDSLGTFDYPKLNPPYFASLYFWSLITPSFFKFYVDDVKITLLQPVDYIHPLNIIFLLFIPISFISFYILYKKKKKKRK